MGLVCKITGHKWHKLPDGKDGCTCSRCGERRNEAQVRERRQIGYKTVYRKVTPDAPDDWTEAVKVPNYKYSTKKVPMNLHFPAE